MKKRQRKPRADSWSLADYARLAAKKGGRLLTRGKPTDCPRVVDSLRVRCRAGHEWSPLAGRLKYGSWCPSCGQSRGTWDVKQFKAFAARQGGKLISIHPPGPIQHLQRVQFCCGDGHEWDALAGQIMQRQTWCGECANAQRHKPVDDIHAICASRGGRLLRKGKNRGHKWVFECAKLHSFTARPGEIQNGNWCPTCSASRPERLVRTYFEQMFGRAFPRVRPKWLRNVTGLPMELDGYCEELALAFEHQGPQHYRRSGGSFTTNIEQIQKRDRLKRRLCKRRGIALIEIPNLLGTLALKNLQRTIVDRCDAAGVAVPAAARTMTIDVTKTYVTTRDEEQLARLQEVCKAKGGRCLAETFVGSNTHTPFECAAGHTWSARPADIFAGTWCMRCARVALGQKKRLTIEAMHQLAASRGGECLSATYTNANTKLRWRCGDCSHEWEASPASVLSGSWCRPCCFTKGWATKQKRYGPRGQVGRPGPAPKYTIEDMQKLAQARGGDCLSKKYINAFTKLRWRCGMCGHKWKAAPNDVRRRSWCPMCAIAARRK